MHASAEQAALVRAIKARVAAFEPGATIAPGVTTVAIAGHTPGHAAALITSAGERLFYIGNTAHHFVISVQRPDWSVEFDVDAPTAQTSRRAVLQRAADENLRVFAVHFPFPGVGRIRKRDEGFVWVPD